MPSWERMRSTCRRSAGSAVPSRRLRIWIVSPPTVTTPSSGVSSRLMQRRNVLLPEPDEPRIEMTSPSRACSETPFSTSSAPKRLRMLTTVRAIGVSGIGIRLCFRTGAARRCGDSQCSSADEGPGDQVVEHEIDGPGDEQRGVGDERVVADFQRDAHHVPERHQRHQRGRLGHRNDLGRIGGQGLAQRDGKNDAAEQPKARHAAGPRRLDLRRRNAPRARRGKSRSDRRPCTARSESTAQEKASRSNGQKMLAPHRRERGQAIIDDEQLDQQRRAAKHEDIGAGEAVAAAGCR